MKNNIIYYIVILYYKVFVIVNNSQNFMFDFVDIARFIKVNEPT